jgi:hypothetical protein
MDLNTDQEIVFYVSHPMVFTVLSRLDEWGLDPLRERYEGRTHLLTSLLLSAFQQSGPSRNINGEFSQYLADHIDEIDRAVQGYIKDPLIQAVQVGEPDTVERLFKEGK